jgi:hemerythrin-like metal-binding protein/PAS domain S-box-containing protein
MVWTALQEGKPAVPRGLYKVFQTGQAQLALCFLGTAILMAAYETLKEFYFEGSLTLWESHSITVGVTATFASIAAYYIRKQALKLVDSAENAQRTAAGVIRNIFDGVVIIDRHGTIKTFNPAAEKIFGYCASEVIGLNISCLMPEPYASEHQVYLERFMATNVSHVLGKSRRGLPGRRSSGETFPMDIMISQMQIDKEQAFIGVVRDISDYTKAATELDRLRLKEKELLDTLQRELIIASEIQQNMIPKGNFLFQERHDIRAFGISRPAKEIGGDFYDAFSIGKNHIVFAIGDVSGKGIPAALFMMKTMALIRSKITRPKKFATALMTINKLLCINNDTNMFSTVFVGMLDTSTGELSYMNAGHNPPLIASRNSSFKLLEVPKNMLLGIYENARYEVAHRQLQQGDSLVLYTDGVTEAENSHEVLYSVERTIAVLSESTSNAKQLTQGLLSDIHQFVGTHPQSDDITILALEYDPHDLPVEETAFFKWNESLSLGNKGIDDQHAVLVDLINRLYNEVINGSADPQIVHEILHELQQYIIIHFEFEEKYLLDTGHCDLEAHLDYHNQFQEKIAVLLSESQANTELVNLELLNDLKNWFQIHINVDDRQLFASGQTLNHGVRSGRILSPLE